MTNLKKTALLLATLVITGCGNPQRNTDDTSKICPAVAGTGLAKQCTINSLASTIDVTIDSLDDEVARETCDRLVKQLSPLTSQFSGAWQLQIFTPYRSDKQTATCVLHELP